MQLLSVSMLGAVFYHGKKNDNFFCGLDIRPCFFLYLIKEELFSLKREERRAYG